MTDDSQSSGISALAADLVSDIKEHLVYLRELGVEHGESFTLIDLTSNVVSSPTVQRRVTTPPQSSALERNARVVATPVTNKPKPFVDAPSTESASHSLRDQTTMAKRNTPRPPAADPPPPQDTLFGEITPKDELSLPRPGETLEDVWNDIGECLRCPLHQSRTHVVNTNGNPQARLMFVGEAPGADEDAQGKPFVGRAGQLLNKMIEAIGMKREDVIIGNVNRCRPPQNRTPTPAEAKTCKPFLLREIAIIKPDLIVVLGNTAMKNLLDTKEGITKLRGQFQDYNGIKVLPTFHPAYLLRDPSKKREAWEDLKKVRDYLQGKTK